MEPTEVQLPPTSPLALSFPLGGEREREPGIRKKNSCSTPHRERYNDKVLGAVAIFSTFVVLLIVYATSINVVYSLLIYSVRTSANEGETDAVVIFEIPHSMYLVSI